jgi:hypothetical protein
MFRFYFYKYRYRLTCVSDQQYILWRLIYIGYLSVFMFINSLVSPQIHITGKDVAYPRGYII